METTAQRETTALSRVVMYMPWPLEVLPLAFVSLTAFAGALVGAPVGDFLARVLGFAIALALISLLVARITRLEARLARLLAGVAITFVVYAAYDPLLRALAGPPIDVPLRAAEEALIGSTLVAQVAPYASDGWTFVFSLAYSVHVPLFFISALLHWRAGQSYRAERVLLTLAIAMYLGFVGYALFPAYGPIHALPELTPLPMNPGTAVVAVYGVALGTFPSLHAGISAAVAIDGWRTSPRWGLAFTLVSALIWVSTIYLRYHWLPDLIAGLLLAAVSTWLAGALQIWWRRRIPL